MYENKNDVHNREEVIDLREVFVALWKRKKMIVITTLIAIITAGLISMFIISPVYDTKLNIVINMPEEYNTKYGQYTLPITTNEQYINLIDSNDVIISTIKKMEYDSNEVTLENLKKRISIEKYTAITEIEQNSFEVTVSADSPDESLKLAQSLYDSYIEFLDVMTKERAINYFTNDFSVGIKNLENQLNSTTEILKKNEELLADTPQIIADGKANIEIKAELNDNSDYVVPIDSVNPNYIKIENDIVNNKQFIIGIENSIRMNSQYIDELAVEKQAISKYYETERAGKLESSVTGVVETSIYLPSPPVEPTQKTSPSNALNIVIGAVIGGIIGIMVALTKEYWFKES